MVLAIILVSKYNNKNKNNIITMIILFSFSIATHYPPISNKVFFNIPKQYVAFEPFQILIIEYDRFANFLKMLL